MKIWSWFLEKVKSGLRSTNIVKIKGALHPTTILKDAIIYGNIEVMERCKLIDGVYINGRSSVFIDRYSSINGPSTDILSAIHPVRIGKFCSIARHVSIQEYYHDFRRLSGYYINQNLIKERGETDLFSKGPITIGNDVWIGAHCVILSGVTIGHGAIIGANSVVTSDIPPYAVAGGSPAKVIKFRFDDDIVQELLRIEWWNWPDEKIKRNKKLFLSSFSKDMLQTIEE